MVSGMTTFEVLVHVSGFRLEVGGDGGAATGFFTRRRVKAGSPEDARKLALAAMMAEPEMEELRNSALRDGLSPEAEVEEIARVPPWRAILPWRQPGRIFYSEEEEEDSAS